MYEISKDFICRTVCGETMLMPVGEKTKEFNGIFTLTETGAIVIDEIKKGGNELSAAKRIAEEFEIDPETAKNDTLAFIGQLLKYGIIEKQK
ncbi:MAG: PqqD family protein [Clostridia bacterium]|nr:PqqD family protein [Clostridia bacterium]